MVDLALTLLTASNQGVVRAGMESAGRRIRMESTKVLISTAQQVSHKASPPSRVKPMNLACSIRAIPRLQAYRAQGLFVSRAAVRLFPQLSFMMCLTPRQI